MAESKPDEAPGVDKAEPPEPDSPEASKEESDSSGTSEKSDKATTGISIAADAGKSLGAVVVGRSLTEAAKAIAKAVKTVETKGKVVIVEDRAVATSDVVLAQTQQRLSALESLLSIAEQELEQSDSIRRHVVRAAAGEEAVGAEDATKEGEQPQAATRPSPKDIGGALEQVAGLVDVFRSSFEVSPQLVDVQRIALIAAVAGELPGNATIPSFADVATSEVFRRAGDVLHRRYAAGARLASLKAAVASTNAALERDRTHLSELRAQYAKALLEGNANAPALKSAIIDLQAEIAAREGNTAYQRLNGMIETVASVVTAIDAGLDALTKSSSDAPPPIVSAALREHVRRARGDKPLVLWVDITASGADRVKRQTPLGWNSEIAFLGAVQATFILADADGTVRSAGANDSFGSQTFDFANFFGELTPEMKTAKKQAMILEYGIMLLIAAVIVLLLAAVVIGVIF